MIDRIMFDSVDGVDLSRCFTTSQTTGQLYPGDKPISIQTVFKADQEITIKDQPMLKCQVISFIVCLCVAYVCAISHKVIQSAITKTKKVIPTSPLHHRVSFRGWGRIYL